MNLLMNLRLLVSGSHTHLRTMTDDFSLSSDRISDLPVNIRQTILMLLPLRDMARTSILSKNWRYQWAKVPQLIFEDFSSSNSHKDRYRYNTETVFGILLQHDGPLRKFTLNMSTCSGIDKIINFLSRNGIHDLTLLTTDQGAYKQLPSSIFSCVELRHLSLNYCVFQPLTFVGFDKLVSLELLKLMFSTNVSISSFPLLERLKLENLTFFDHFSVDAPKLKSLYLKGCFSSISHMNTPLLKVLSLTGESFRWNDCKLDLMKLLRSLPLLENLHLYYMVLKLLAVDNSTNECQTVLNNLRKLQLDSVNLMYMDELSSTLWLIRNSPNLQKLKIMQIEHMEPAVTVVPEPYLKMKDDSSYCSFLKLQEVEAVLYLRWCNLRYYVEFFKFLLAMSPELKTICIKDGSETVDVGGYKLLLDLACVSRASVLFGEILIALYILFVKILPFVAIANRWISDTLLLEDTLLLDLNCSLV